MTDPTIMSLQLSYIYQLRLHPRKPGVGEKSTQADQWEKKVRASETHDRINDDLHPLRKEGLEEPCFVAYLGRPGRQKRVVYGEAHVEGAWRG